MKRLYMVLSIFMLICLCSCGGDAKHETIRDNPSTEIWQALDLTLVEEGASINKDLDRSGSYVDVRIATDTKASAFYQVIDLEEQINDRFYQVIVKPLYFNGSIPVDDVNLFLTEMNHEAYGLSSTNVKVDFKMNEVEGVKYSDTLYKNISLAYTLSLPSGYTSTETDPAKLVVAYLPTYCTYNDGKEDLTKVFVLVPIYYAFVTKNTVADYTAGLKEYTIELTEQGLLPSYTAE